MCDKCKIDDYEPIRRVACPKCGRRVVMVIEPLWDAIAGISDKSARKASVRLAKQAARKADRCE
ncbi:MAG: hypothetical protein LBO72_04580 [Helicobacteraceae bacterium]|nr:hypothetical protein [Helicobacteraceae bacterium]